MGGRTCVASWVALSTPVLFFFSASHILRTRSSTKYFSRRGRRQRGRSIILFSASHILRTRSSTNYFSRRGRRQRGRSIICFLLSLIKFKRIIMFLHGKMFFKIRHHQYIYVLILALPLYPSFASP